MRKTLYWRPASMFVRFVSMRQPCHDAIRGRLDSGSGSREPHVVPVCTATLSKRRKCLLLAAFSATTVALNARAVPAKHFDIVYPQIRTGGDVHTAFALAVLSLAMKAANVEYTTRQAEVVMESGRALAELANDDTIAC